MAKASSRKVKLGTTKASSGSVPCNMCKGTGRLKEGYNRKKK